MGPEGARFTAVEDIKSKAMTKLRKVPKEVFRWSFQRWQD
jgi:hypothetical protein